MWLVVPKFWMPARAVISPSGGAVVGQNWTGIAWPMSVLAE